MTEAASQHEASSSAKDESQKWCDIAVDVTSEVSTTTLNLDATLKGPLSGLPDHSYGGYLQLSNDAVVILVAITAEKDACEALSRALLFLEEDEEVSADDMSDAMGEIVNMVGGGMKTKGADLQAGLNLGLPFFVEGRLEVPDEVVFSGAEVNVGEHQLWISLMLRETKD